MNPRSKKAKGSRFERYIAHEIELAGLGQAKREAMSGAGWRKGDIASNLPFLIECKNQKTLRWWQAIDQTKGETEQGNKDPEKWALIVRDPRTSEVNPRAYVVMDFWEWLKLLKKESEPLIKEPDRELKYDLVKLKYLLPKIIKQL